MISDVRTLVKHPGFKKRPVTTVLRTLVWLVHCLLKVPVKAKFRKWEFVLCLPPKYKGAGATFPFIFREYYEPELKLLKYFLSEGMVFVDGGANTGIYTFMASSMVGPGGKVLAFEPGSMILNSLKQSVQINKKQNVVVFEAALSDKTGTAKLYHNEGENAHSLGSTLGSSFEMVETLTLSAALIASGVQTVDFIKLDIEGAEEIVLRHSEKLLMEHRPTILFEIAPSHCKRMNLSPQGVINALQECDYEIHFLDSNGALITTNTYLDNAPCANYLAYPMEKVMQMIPTKI